MRIALVVLTLFAAALAATAAKAAVVFEHFGNVAPSTESWTTTGPGTGVTQGSITNDLGLGVDAWFVDDNSTAGGSFLVIQQSPSGAQNTEASTEGWILRANLRVADVPDAVDQSVFAEYTDATTTWLMEFGAEADGDPIVRLSTGPATGPTYTLQGEGSAYDLYELVYDPAAGTADLFVNGIERISGYGGRTAGVGTRVVWGGGQSSSTGQGNFNLVQWEIVEVSAVPSLGAFGLALLVGVMGLGGCRRLRR